MNVSSKSMVEINRLDQLARTLDMKDLGATKTNIGHGNIQRLERW
jgi:hypothetical protein